jgi:YHS domain-containing protein
MKVKDPVCGMKIEKEEAERVEYMGKEYYFCSHECAEKFKDNPEQYAHQGRSRGCCH